MPTFNIVTFGCQMNQRDSEILAGLLLEKGYEHAALDEEPDVVVFNTCCVRETAERRLLGRIAQYRSVKRRQPDVVVAVVGCLAQQPGATERIKAALPSVDVVLGTHNMHTIVDALEQAGHQGSVIDVWPEEQGIIEQLPSERAEGIKAWVSIMQGCNNFCSYCIVPYVRGRERSRNPENIVGEIEELVAKGYKEVTLLGQNVNSYGKTLARDFDFADLLMKIEHIDGLLRLRYMTSHPRDMTHRLVDTIAEASKVCEHFHLPVQAGSNTVLDRMNRGYTRERYLDLVRYIRSVCPTASLTTDFIVGFPGETDNDFEDTLDLVKTVRFDAAFTFVYSLRSGTRAATMANQVPEETKKRRISELLSIQNSITQQKNKDYIGRRAEVLVEGLSPNDCEKMTGRTRTDKTVNFDGPNLAPGSLATVEITGSGTWTLRGRIAP